MKADTDSDLIPVTRSEANPVTERSSLYTVCVQRIKGLVFGTHPAHVGFAGIELAWNIRSL
jgi:hypothetical protein